jgi:[ribosomal protein S18]-alanine N-acetyltransferase
MILDYSSNVRSERSHDVTGGEPNTGSPQRRWGKCSPRFERIVRHSEDAEVCSQMPAKMKLIIRRATRGDVAAIIRIENASFGCGAWGRDDFLDYLAQPENCIFLVAIAGGVVAGYIIGFYKHKRAEVDSVAVKHSHRGRGVAATLMARLMSLLRRRGFSILKLTVRLENTGAIALYRKLGFVRERRINGYYEDGAPAWRMSLALKQCFRLNAERQRDQRDSENEER